MTVTREAFLEIERLELVSKDATGQSLIATSPWRTMVENNGDLAALERHLGDLFPEI